MRKQKENQNKYQVTYDKKMGGTGTMVVIADNESNAIKNAKFLRFTGSNFRDAKTVEWSTESESGNTSGSHRMN